MSCGLKIWKPLYMETFYNPWVRVCHKLWHCGWQWCNNWKQDPGRKTLIGTPPHTVCQGEDRAWSPIDTEGPWAQGQEPTCPQYNSSSLDSVLPAIVACLCLKASAEITCSGRQIIAATVILWLLCSEWCCCSQSVHVRTGTHVSTAPPHTDIAFSPGWLVLN